MKLIIVLFIFTFLSYNSDAVTVSTKYGDVIGQTWTIHSGQSVNSFLAIPYAKSPVGSLRFAKPEEPEPWTEPFVANALGAACPQEGELLLLTHLLWNKFSEDCLHLNIYTPQNISGGPYAVMVWFHGGGYQGSANIQYPGYFLAARDVVVVVPNYRLGILGFATTEDEVASGNWGLWDQNLVLKFVQENIANFGGDPNKVTLFGQSAGASSSGLHTVSPKSKGMFHQAIMESGSDSTLWSLNYPGSIPSNYTKQIAQNLSCPIDRGSLEMIDCLRKRDAEDIRKQDFECTPGWLCQGFGPVVDGPSGFLPDTPQDTREAGEHAKIDIMAGQCNKDGSLYTIALIPEASDGGFNRSTFVDIIRNRLVDYFAPRLDSPKKVEDVAQALLFHYTPWPHMDDTEEDDQNRQAFNDMVTDVGFGYAQDKINKLHMRDGNKVYYYILSYRTTGAEGILPDWIGVPHNGELPYVWGYGLLRKNEHLREESEIWFDILEWDEKDAEYAEYISDMWTNFAKFGNPTPEPVKAPDGSNTSWPTYQEGSLKYLNIDSTIKEEINYRQRDFAFWQEYIPYISGLDTYEIIQEIMVKLHAEARKGN